MGHFHKRKWLKTEDPEVELLRSGEFLTVMKPGSMLFGYVRDEAGAAISGASILQGESAYDDDDYVLPDFAALSEGSHTVYFRVGDDAGNWKLYKLCYPNLYVSS